MSQNDDPCPESGEVEYELENALTTLENVQKELDSCNERLTASQISVSNARKQMESARKKSTHSKDFPSQNSAEFVAVKEECGNLWQRIRVMETEMESLREENCQLIESHQSFMNGCKCQANVRHQSLVHVKEEEEDPNTACSIPLLQFESPKHELVDDLNVEPQLSSNKISEFDVTTESAPMGEDKFSPGIRNEHEQRSCRRPSSKGWAAPLKTNKTRGKPPGEEDGNNVCPHCSRTFTFVKSLELHLQTCTREKQFECNECDKRFKSKAHLTRHQRIHTGEKPFKCNWCDKRFKLKHDLKSHQRIHTGEKPFKCKWCDKRFNQSNGATAHERRRHMGEKPHKCQTCSYQCSDYRTLLKHKHMRTRLELMTSTVD